MAGTRQKKFNFFFKKSLPSAMVLALGKVPSFAECRDHSTRQIWDLSQFCPVVPSFAECYGCGTRQRVLCSPLPSATLGKSAENSIFLFLLSITYILTLLSQTSNSHIFSQYISHMHHNIYHTCLHHIPPSHASITYTSMTIYITSITISITIHICHKYLIQHKSKCNISP